MAGTLFKPDGANPKRVKTVDCQGCYRSGDWAGPSSLS